MAEGLPVTQLFSDPEAERICARLDYDFAERGKGMEPVVGRFGNGHGARTFSALAA